MKLTYKTQMQLCSIFKPASTGPSYLTPAGLLLVRFFPYVYFIGFGHVLVCFRDIYEQNHAHMDQVAGSQAHAGIMLIRGCDLQKAKDSSFQAILLVADGVRLITRHRSTRGIEATFLGPLNVSPERSGFAQN